MSMNEKELKRRAEKLVARASALGIAKDGKPLVIDQAYELIAAEEGARNQHALRAGMPDPKVKALREKEGYAEWVGIVNELTWNDASMVTHLEGFLGEKGLWAEFADYARSVADEELADSSGDDSQDEDSQEDVDLDDVAEWVGLHYKVNFDAESPAERVEWVRRYKESHEPTLAETMSQATDLLEKEWGYEHLEWTRADWQHDVRMGDTKLGYWEWVVHQLESAENDRFVCARCKRSHDIEDSIQTADGELLCDTCANRKAADAAFESYDFGEFFRVADHEGWEWDGIDTLTKKVFLEAVNLPDEPTRLVRFRVQVDNGKVLSISVS